MFRRFLLLACLCTFSNSALAQVTIENDRMALAADKQGVISILEKQSGRRWQEAAPIEREEQLTSGTVARDTLARVQSVEKDGDSILLRAEWTVPLEIRWTLEADGVRVSIDSPDKQREIFDPSLASLGPALAYPAPFYASEAEQIILPEDEGLTYSTSETDPEYDKYRWLTQRVDASKFLHLSMPWFGLTDAAFNTGLMTLNETPYYSTYRLALCKTGDGNRALPMFLWLSKRGSFGEERTMRFLPIEQGGYVAMCKVFRKEMQEAGQFRTLREKIEKNPNVAKLIGALNMWIFTDHAEQRKFVPLSEEDMNKIHEMGFEKLALQTFNNTRPEPGAGFTPEAVKAATDFGWLVGYYHLYSWTYTSDPEKDSPERTARVVQESNGKPRVAGSQWGRHYKHCGATLEATLTEVAGPEAAYGLTSFFSDCTTAGSTVHDCYHPEHPATREEGYKGTSDALAAVAEIPMVVGSERGAWWATPGADYFEGIETIFQYFVHFTGKHTGPMMKDAPDYEKYHVNYNYGPRNRLPLFQLVYHDSVVCNRRWEDHHSRDEDLWRMNDLLCILYGTQPIVRFQHPTDPHPLVEGFEKYLERYQKTYREVCGWHGQVGLEEMTGHKILDDQRLVQESTFANGKSVVVNFGKTPWKDDRGFEVEPMGFSVR